jgi:hypothetical protein
MERRKFSVGDHVRLLTEEELKKLPGFDHIHEIKGFTFHDNTIEVNNSMRTHCGRIFQVSAIGERQNLSLSGLPFVWSSYCFEMADSITLIESDIKKEIYG